MKIYIVKELYMGCCYIEGKEVKYFTDEREANKYAEDGNNSKEARDFVEAYRWDDVEYKFFVSQVELH